jgi:hypothetical protein
MDRNIRKSIFVNELEYIFFQTEISPDKRSQLMIELFEEPQARNIYLLKENIRTLSELEIKIKKIIAQQDNVLAILNTFSVKDDLTIPNELRPILLGNEPVAFFVGAGLSKLLEIPLWEELGLKAINYLKDNNYLNHSESTKLKNDQYTPKQILSIFHQVIRDKKERQQFYTGILTGKENKNGNPYELLFEIEEALARPLLKISTNIDLEWENLLKDKANKQSLEIDIQGKRNSETFYECTQYKNFVKDQNISNNILYQIHGSLHDIDEAIITTDGYVNNYRDENGLKGFLEKVFKEYIVLFLGSGIQEFEILEHCLKQSPFKHFALVGNQVGEQNLFRLKKRYFSELGIKVLPYYMDFQGYDRILFVLHSWVDEIRSIKSRKFYDDIKLIDEVLLDA